jgi:hypothetical protein
VADPGSGLAELAGGRLKLTANVRAALGRPPAETIRGLWRLWICQAVIDELSRVEHIKGQRCRVVYGTRAAVLVVAKQRRRSAANLDNGVGKGLRGFLRNVVTDTPQNPV